MLSAERTEQHSSHEAVDDVKANRPYVPVPIPAHVPGHLAITLWDFSWYVRSGPGEPFEDLDRVAAEAVVRGYNTVRICAMPYLLFGSGLDTRELSLDRLGGDYAQNVRWYDVGSPTVIDGKARLLELFHACKRHGLFVILSSWEYQQSSSFSVNSAWWDALRSVEPEERPVVLAESFAALIDFLKEHDVADAVAFTELHNEVQYGHLTDGLVSAREDEPACLLALKPRLARGLARFHELQPHVPVTVNYGGVPVAAMRAIPERIDVLVTHPYIYGVLDEVTAAFDLRGDLQDFPRGAVDAAGILREGAPDPAMWTLGARSLWKMEATVIGKPEIYLHDWVDPAAFDRYLYERYQAHRSEMDRVLQIWIEVAADHARHRGIPFVFGEGWIGYTPCTERLRRGPWVPSSAVGPCGSRSVWGPGVQSCAPMPLPTIRCGQTSPCSLNATRSSHALPGNSAALTPPHSPAPRHQRAREKDMRCRTTHFHAGSCS